MTEIVGTLLARFRCWRRGHSMHVNDASRRDETGYLRWPCQRCGQVQRLPYGLAANGHITDKRLGNECHAECYPPRPVDPAWMPARQLTEDDVRRIVREELAKEQR